MSTGATHQDIAEPEREILGALESVENNIMRRVDLADVIEEPYPPHERSLTDRTLIEEVGVHSTRNEDGEQVVYRRLTLTEQGERALRRSRAQEGDEEQEPDPVEPKTRRARRRPWHERAEWTELSPDVPRLLEETQSVEYNDEANEIHVTLDHAGREATLEFSKTAWFNTGHKKFHEQYHTAFNERNPVDEREFGVLQARWVDMPQEADGVGEAKTAKERAKAYLSGEGVDDSVREAAQQLDVSVGTVQSARSELSDELNGED